MGQTNLGPIKRTEKPYQLKTDEETDSLTGVPEAFPYINQNKQLNRSKYILWTYKKVLLPKALNCRRGPSKLERLPSL